MSTETVKKKGGAILHIVWVVVGAILGLLGHDLVIPESTGEAVQDVRDDIDVIREGGDVLILPEEDVEPADVVADPSS